jgi:putative addiction module killer protein
VVSGCSATRGSLIFYAFLLKCLQTIVCSDMLEFKVDQMAKATTPKHIVFYQDDKGKEPFTEWLNALRDKDGRRRILVRLRRLEQGNYGDCSPIGEGLSELRLFFGSGYRVYFGEDEGNIIVILCGGDKSSQNKDIIFVKSCWKEYLNNDKK